MKKRRVLLRVNLGHGAVPVELAMAAAGFHRPDATPEWLCGWIPVDGVDRYHEARTPPALAACIDAPPKDVVVECVAVFQCTEQPAEPDDNRNHSPE